MSIKSFFANRRGNTAVLFGFAAFGLAAAVGGSIDLGRMLVARSSLQDAADAAVLRAATVSSGTSTAAQETAAHQAFTSNLSGDVSGHITSKKLARDTDGVNTSLTYTASAQLPTYLLQLVDIDYFDLSVVSEAKAQMRKSEIVFVLDVTGSMVKNDRIGNLKTSVNTVLSSLLTSGQNLTGTKVGIVPFDEQVRVDKGTNLTWVDYGKATSSQGCSGLSGSYCTMMIDALERACMKTSNPLACKATSKLYTKTYKGTASGETNRTYFEVFVKVYSSASNQSNTHTEKSYEIQETYTTTGGTSCSKETGACSTTTGGQSATRTKTTFVSQSGTSASGKAGYDATNNIPAGFTDVKSSVLTYSSSYGNGYDGIDARSVNSTTNGQPKTTYFPAVDANRAAWPGCIIDREQPYDISAESPGSSTASKYPARACKTGTLGVVKPLTTNITDMKDYVNNLKIGGNSTFTNITIGVQWGMEVLSAPDPMPGGVPFNDEITSKYMILVTDGENNQNRWTSNTAEIDKRTKAACEAARAKGITVFVIRLMEGDSDLLEGCASKTEYYYDLQQATELGAALKDVFEAIKKTRLTK